jgi:ABC-type transporter Mla subunit MlaD
MADTNLYEDLKDALQDLKDFLQANTATIKPAVQALAGIVPQVVTLIDELIGLLQQVKTEIQNLNVGAIPGLAEVSGFTDNVTTFLETAKALLPEQKETIEDVLGAASVVGSLPSLDQVKGEIISLIDAIIANLNQLKPGG